MHLGLYNDVRLKKIFIKNFLIFVSAVFLIIAMLVLPFSNRLSEVYRKQLANVNDDYLKRAGDMCDSIIAEVEAYIISISVNDEVAALVSAADEGNYTEAVQKHLKFYKGINKYIDSVSVYNFRTGNMVHDTSVVYMDKNGIPSEYEIKINTTTVNVCAKNGKYPFVVRMVRGIEISGNNAAIIIDVDVDRFNSLFENIDEGYVNQLIVTTAGGEFVYGDKLKERFKKPIESILRRIGDDIAEIDGEKFVYSEKTSERTGLKYLSLMPFDYYTASTKDYILYVIIIAAVSLIMGIILALLMTKKSVSHIDIILAEIDNNNSGVRSRKSPIEIRCIVDDIRKSVKKTEDMGSEISSRMLLLKLAQAQALQTQINPHFLHNTFEMINWMAYKSFGKENEISECITELSEMFRRGLETDEYIVSLSDEVEHAKAYCKLLEIRFENNIRVEFDVPGNLLSANTVKFILQPLIENAVYHGIRPRGETGNIMVKVINKEKDLFISVSDNGIGMEEAKIEKIARELKKGAGNLDEQIVQLIRKWNVDEAESENGGVTKSWWLGRTNRDVGIGIKNVNNRIKMIFGENYGLRLMKNESGGITAEVKIPLIEK